MKINLTDEEVTKIKELLRNYVVVASNVIRTEIDEQHIKDLIDGQRICNNVYKKLSPKSAKVLSMKTGV